LRTKEGHAHTDGSWKFVRRAGRRCGNPAAPEARWPGAPGDRRPIHPGTALQRAFPPVVAQETRRGLIERVLVLDREVASHEGRIQIHPTPLGGIVNPSHVADATRGSHGGDWPAENAERKAAHCCPLGIQPAISNHPGPNGRVPHPLPAEG